MAFKFHTTTTDQFNDVGEGHRVNGEVWYRTDLNEIRAYLNGKIVTLFNGDGTPGKLPDNVVRK